MARPVDFLRHAHRIAVVGLSTDATKASARVAVYLHDAGYRIYPVHPTARTWRGLSVYPTLDDVPEPMDIVDVFRPATEAPEWARAAIRNGARVLWLQQGIVSDEAAEIARAGGLDVVMDRCTLVEHRQLVREAAVQLSQ